MGTRGRKARTEEEWAIYIIANSIKNEKGCWEFKNRNDKLGYGNVYVGGKGGKNQYTHRIVYKQLVGEIPFGAFVCHKCDNPPCCNPGHLFISDNKGNMKDKVEKGRAYISWGERSGQAKLTTKQVLAIRSDHRTRTIIAKEYGVVTTPPTKVGGFYETSQCNSLTANARATQQTLIRVWDLTEILSVPNQIFKNLKQGTKNRFKVCNSHPAFSALMRP